MTSKPRKKSKPRRAVTKLKEAAGRPQTLKHVTLRDVAIAAGVSPMTVSNFINSRLGTMSIDTKDRIEKVVGQLGYRPHTMARSLRLAKRNAIDMVIVDDAPEYLADPFITQIVAGLSNHLNSQGYALQLQAVPAADFYGSSLVRNLRSDGICVMMSGSDGTRRKFIESLLQLGQPVVAFQETFAIGGSDLCVVLQNDREGGRMLAREVLARDPRKVVALAPGVTWPAISRRIAGVHDVLNGAASSVELRVVHCGNADFSDTQAALEKDIASHGDPDAIIAGNDQMGIAAMKLMSRHGRRVPADVAITGFNAFEFWQYTEPVLTTIRSPAYQMGARGGAEILSRLSTGRFASPRIVFPVELQRGGST
jgi:LacI family transcriptional regulator